MGIKRGPKNKRRQGRPVGKPVVSSMTAIRPGEAPPHAQAAAVTRVDVNTTGTTQGGLSGAYELVLRRFKTAVHCLTLVPLYGLASIVFGLALTPALALLRSAWLHSEGLGAAARLPLLGVAAAAAWFVFGFALLATLPVANFFLGRGLRAWRGPYYSIQCVRWYIHNGLTYLARYTFLEFVTPTPLNLMFYRAMGMKIGRDSQLNTTNISDPALIELGEKVTIGGSATLVAHYGMGGFLVIAPVKIGNGATIGLKATVMGGAEIGEGAKIMPNSVVLPRTKVPAGETWGGVPARKLELERPSEKPRKRAA